MCALQQVTRKSCLRHLRIHHPGRLGSWLTEHWALHLLLCVIAGFALTESTKRLCMRKKQKVKKEDKVSEALFLRSRRNAVAKSASSHAVKNQKQTPAWMRKLSRRLWSKQHAAELQFNQRKYQKKAVVAYKAGMLKPRGAAAKRKFQQDLSKHERAAKKRRTVYDRSIAKRC